MTNKTTFNQCFSLVASETFSFITVVNYGQIRLKNKDKNN